MSISIIMSFLVVGCQEVVKPEQDVLEKKTLKVEIEKKIDFSDVYTPSEVCVYSASLWEAEDDNYIVNVFLGNKKVKKISYAEGPQYVYTSNTKEKEVVTIYDGGKSFFGRKENPMEAGVNYGYIEYVYFDQMFSEYKKIRNEYYERMRIISKKLDEKDKVFLKDKKEVAEYLEMLHMENYVVDEAAIFKENKIKGCLIYLTQVINKLPISNINFDKSSNRSGTTVYNSKLPYNTNMVQKSSMLETEFINNRLVGWWNHDVINVEKKLKQSPIVSVEEAYKKVEEQYQNYSSEVRMPILEIAELQYKIIELNGKVYLYPVWTFCVSTEEIFKDGYTGEEHIELEYNYFLIDAITGDYFTDIDTKEFES